MARKISVSVPEEMLPQIDNAARRQHRSRADVIREALRRCLASGRVLPLADANFDEVEALKRGRAELERGDFVRLEDLQRELGLPPR